MPRDDEKITKSADANGPRHRPITDLQLGVYKLRYESSVTTIRNPRELWDESVKVAAFVRRLFVDLYRVAPYHFLAYLFLEIAGGLEDLFVLGFSDGLLRVMEKSLVSASPDINAVLLALLWQLAVALIFVSMKWYSKDIEAVLHTKVTSHFQLMIMRANLNLDLASSLGAAGKMEDNLMEVWDSFTGIVHLSAYATRSASQMAFITVMLRSGSGPLFVLLSVAHPLLNAYIVPTLWDKACYGYISNAIYQRIKALEKFVEGKLRQDIIANGLAGWITSEFQNAHRRLGNLSSRHPYYQFMLSSSLPQSLFFKLTELAPMIFCALNFALRPAQFSVTSAAILQQSSTHLRLSLQMTLIQARLLARSLAVLKRIYRAEETVPKALHTGIIPYPDPRQESPSSGMAFELNDVHFSYPGTQKTTPALRGVSLRIRAGQTVVIVGANGSGKSTLVRLLARLYDPSSGTMNIDGRPCAEYITADLHSATALLSQDTQLYPVSLGENIGLGFHPLSADRALVEEAAAMGGATEFIGKLKDGMDTVLEPILDEFEINLRGDEEHVLYKEMEALRKKIDISGGEKQKVVASRTFMRFHSGKIRFVAVDEPSSALDAEAELKLFDNLIKTRKGKTLVFVTHRFGHLTKYADLIICMKDGKIVETGTHQELMEREGEYASLYEIQASAFSDTATNFTTPLSAYNPIQVAE